MMKKRLSKKIWYGSEVDNEGNPIVPELAKDSEDLEGIHHGELYLHEADDKLSLWVRTLTNQVKPIGGLGGGGDLWKLMETETGEKYLFTEMNVVTQMGLTSFASVENLDLPSIYDGLVIDNQTIVWEVVDGVKTLVAKGSGSGEGTIKDVVVNVEGNANAITNVELSADKTGLVFTKGLEFAGKKYVDDNFKKYLPLTGGTMSGSITLDGGSGGTHGETVLNNGSLVYSPSWGQDFVIQSYGGQISFNTYGGVKIDGGQITYNASEGYFQLDGDLLVTGGITAFADRYSPTSIMDAIVTDEQTITVEDINGVKTLKVIGGADKGVKVELVTSADQATEADTLYVIV